MKKLIALLVLALLAFVAFVAAGPFLTVKSIGDAVQRGDMRTLEREVDFPLVRASLKAQLEDYLARSMGDPSTDSRLRELGRQVTATMTGGVVDALATPAGIGAILQGRSVIRRAMGYPAERSGEPGAAFDPLRDARYSYESGSRFTATVNNADGVPIVFVFTREGIDWRLTDVRLPVDRLIASLTG
ncbi:hypothetical protein GCM10008101_09730 [Lysobacter xinjiangensis]|jgi:hypothetical protein|uniref:DUF2939 domain-containing protein n=1 Tax=Cognatilysobacter xinjiangensis TaxID=546892 RepID=A0ABQ3BX10_9GAMM|nr:DUF2939 domain-containing protein [Lysobacter xinjiangensis]GGZ58083.1 hypothetical protein GCM10008101_09730 [Lysobacter xinjiangensis]